MNRPPSSKNLLQQLPTKWAIAVVVALILYVLVQPWLNNRFGWRLPSLGEDPTTKARQDPDSIAIGETDPPAGIGAARSAQKEQAPNDSPSHGVGLGDRSNESSASTDRSTKETRSFQEADATSRPAPGTPAKGQDASPVASTGTKKSSEPSSLRYGLLTDLGKNRYRSPAGLIYGPGSEEGHRLKHLERHLTDQPNRPSKHGVFDGDMASALRWIDDAWSRSKRKAKGTSVRMEDGRSIVEASFDKPIGFVGGREGARNGNPPARKLRLVVEGDEFVTAFPF